MLGYPDDMKPADLPRSFDDQFVNPIACSSTIPNPACEADLVIPFGTFSKIYEVIGFVEHEQFTRSIHTEHQPNT